MKSYRIRILAPTDCWVADIEGDPGRTLVSANAKVFSRNPIKEIGQLARKYPRRVFSIEFFEKQEQKYGQDD